MKIIPVKHFSMHVGFCENGLIPVRWVSGLPITEAVSEAGRKTAES